MDPRLTPGGTPVDPRWTTTRPPVDPGRPRNDFVYCGEGWGGAVKALCHVYIKGVCVQISRSISMTWCVWCGAGLLVGSLELRERTGVLAHTSELPELAAEFMHVNR